MRIRHLLGAALLAGQVACASVKPDKVPDPQVPTRSNHTWDDPEVLATWQALEPGHAPPADVLTPTEAFAAALTFNPQMALLKARVNIGRAGVMVAKQRVNPVLSLTPERVVNAALGVSPWVAAISLVWPVQTAGKRSLAIEQALATSDASMLNAANEIWMLRTLVRNSLCATEVASARLVLAREEFALRDDLTARMSKQADAGMISNYEVARARLERDRAAQSVRRDEAAVLSSKRELTSATALPFAEIERRNPGNSCLDAGAATDAVTDAGAGAVSARLDLREKLAEYRVADAAWRKEVARRVPDLNLGPGYTYDQGARKVTFTISGELPIYARNDAAIANASAERSRAIAEVEILQYAVLDGVDRARDRLSAAQLLYGQSVQAVSRSREFLERDLERQIAGELDKPAAVVSRLALVSALTDMLLAQQEQSNALAAFEAATQAPVAPPFFDGRAAQALASKLGSPEEGPK